MSEARAPLSSPRAITALVVVVTAIVFLPAIGLGFVNYDDGPYVFDNVRVRSGITLDNLRWSLTATFQHNWHPLTWWSYFLDASLFGLSPRAMHAENVLLHALTAGVLARVIMRLGLDARAAGAAALLWAVHPLRVESVAWISQRKDALAALFFVVTLWAALRARQQPSRAHLVLALAAFAAGLMAKPTLVAAPGVLLVVDLAFVGVSVRDAVRRTLPFLALAIAVAVLTMIAQGAAIDEASGIALGDRLRNAPVSIVRYLAHTVAPIALSPLYALRTWSTAEALGAAALVLAIVAGSFAAGARVLGGVLWFLGMFVPVLGLVQVGSTSMADRYTLLPHMGLVVALAFLLARVGARAPLFLAAFALVCAPMTIAQIEIWSSTRALFERAIAREPDNALAHLYLSRDASLRGDDAAAFASAVKAAQLAPDSPLAIERLGVLLHARGESAEAERALLAVVEVDASRVEAWRVLAAIARARGDEALAREREARAPSPAGP